MTVQHQNCHDLYYLNSVKGLRWLTDAWNITFFPVSPITGVHLACVAPGSCPKSGHTFMHTVPAAQLVLAQQNPVHILRIKSKKIYFAYVICTIKGRNIKVCKHHGFCN